MSREAEVDALPPKCDVRPSVCTCERTRESLIGLSWNLMLIGST